MIELTLEETKRLLNEAVEERGAEYVYPNATKDGDSTCRYVHYQPDGDTPGCIVGWVLHKAGIPLPELSKSEGENAVAAVRRLGINGLLRTDPEVSTLLRKVQGWQDHAASWGKAVEKGLANVGWEQYRLD